MSLLTHQPNTKKVAAKLYNTTQQPTTPASHRQARIAPAHPRPALAVTTTPTTPRRQAPTELMAPSAQRRMKTMLSPKKTTDGTIDAEADEDDANAKKTTNGTINTDTDDNDADAKMMGDTPPYAQQTLQSQ
jgi:hypothetical protein